MRYWGILPAAGNSSRLSGDCPKQYRKINQRYIIDHSLAALFSHPLIETVVVSLKKNDSYWQFSEYAQDQRVFICQGGVRREHSVWAAMQQLHSYCSPNDWVLVHDAARPCLSAGDLAYLISSLQNDSVGGILTQAATDAIKESAGDDTIKKSLKRQNIYRAQTPQMFRYQLLFNALEGVIQNDVPIDDEAAAMELMNHRVRLLTGTGFNIKITHRSDLVLAKAWLDYTAEVLQ